jgi:hypothetical protein
MGDDIGQEERDAHGRGGDGAAQEHRSQQQVRSH